MLAIALSRADALRGALLRGFGPWARPLLVRREVRAAWWGAALVCVSLAATAVVPMWLLALGPIVWGVPHVLSDVRYLVVRAGDHRRVAVAAPMVLGLVASALGGGLRAAVAGAENHGRRRLRDAVAEQLRSSGITGTIDVSVPGGPVPVVLPALFGRGLSELEIRIRDGQVAGLPVARADYVLTDLQGDVSLRTGQVHVRSIGGGDVRIEVAPSALADSIGTELVIRDGRLRAGPDELLVDTEVVGDALVLSGPAESLWGAPIEVPIADGYLLPCTPEVSIRRSVVVLSCRGSKLPGVLRAPLGIDSRGGSDVAPVGSLVPPASTVVAGPGTATTTEDPVTTTIAPTTIAPTETVPVVTVAPPVEPVPAPG